MTERPVGRRYSRVYSVRGTPEADSARARFRLAMLCDKCCPHSKQTGYASYTSEYARPAQAWIQEELGVPFPNDALGRGKWEVHFKQTSIADMLDTITIVAKSILHHQDDEELRNDFVNDADRILKEENLAYEIDREGGVHPFIDLAFGASVRSSLAGLDEPRYVGTASHVEQIEASLLSNPADYIGAIQSVFAACENLFKLMYDVPRLDSATAQRRIGADQQRHYKDHPITQRASTKALSSFMDWVDAAHFYRHAQGHEIIEQPSEELAVLLISQGVSFVRWLASLDKQNGQTRT